MRGFQILNTTGTVGSKIKKDQKPADASVSGDDLAQNELHHCGRLDDKVVHQIMRNWAWNEVKEILFWQSGTEIISGMAVSNKRIYLGLSWHHEMYWKTRVWSHKVRHVDLQFQGFSRDAIGPASLSAEPWTALARFDVIKCRRWRWKVFLHRGDAALLCSSPGWSQVAVWNGFTLPDKNLAEEARRASAVISLWWERSASVNSGRRRLLSDGFYLFVRSYSVTDGEVLTRASSGTNTSTEHFSLKLACHGFYELQKDNKAVLLKRRPSVMWWNDKIKRKPALVSTGGVPTGHGCGVGRIGILGHGRQGFHHGDARQRHLWLDPDPASQPRQQPHNCGQGDRSPDPDCPQTGRVWRDEPDWSQERHKCEILSCFWESLRSLRGGSISPSSLFRVSLVIFVFNCQNCSVLIALGFKKGGGGGQQVTDGTISQVYDVRLVFYWPVSGKTAARKSAATKLCNLYMLVCETETHRGGSVHEYGERREHWFWSASSEGGWSPPRRISRSSTRGCLTERKRSVSTWAEASLEAAYRNIWRSSQGKGVMILEERTSSLKVKIVNGTRKRQHIWSEGSAAPSNWICLC